MFVSERARCGRIGRRKCIIWNRLPLADTGHPIARYNLCIEEEEKGKYDRAMKHLIIAAALGHDASLNALMDGFKDGLVSKKDFAAALRAHQAAIDATKSPQREAAEKARKD